MRTIATIAALLLCAAGQAQTVDICDRTPQVRDARLEAVDTDDCAAVDSEGLAGVVTLWLGEKGLTELQAGDFDGLTGANDESVSIEGVDDQDGNAGPVTLTLAAGESRALSAFELENGAQGLTGTLGDGAGKWRSLITTRSSVVRMSLHESATGHLTNISTAGVAGDGQ